MLSELDLVLPGTGAPGHSHRLVTTKRRHIVGMLAGTLAVAACIALAGPIIGLVAGYRTMVVTSGSMDPYAAAGDAIVLRENGAKAVVAGDVVTFHPLRGRGVVTHRVVQRVDVEGVTHLQTQGDANATPDADLVPLSNVVGTVVLRLPRLGRFYAFATSTVGRIALVVAPALLLAWSELRTLLPRRRSRRNSRWTGRPLTAASLSLVTVLVLAGTASGLFAESNAVGSNAFATSAVNAPDLTSAVGGSTLLNCRITLNWTAPGAGLGPDGYDIYRSTTNGGPYSLVQHVGVSTSFVNNGLAAATTYFFVVQSSRSAWRSGNSNQRSATTPLLCL